ncbi:MAG: hypothetical protein RL318_1731 [Fibrobacterota bacterium]|jgi:hypothetical protein
MKAILHRHGAWIAAAVAFSLCARFLWPSLVQDSVTAWNRTKALETALPDSSALRERVQRLASDSIKIREIQATLDRRVIHAADPGGQAVEECLGLLAPARWGLERVQPEVIGERVRIRLSGTTDLAGLRKGMNLLERGERRMRVKSLNLRKAQPRLQFDLELVFFRKEGS